MPDRHDTKTEGTTYRTRDHETIRRRAEARNGHPTMSLGPRATLAAVLLAGAACASCAGDRPQVASRQTAGRYNAMGWLEMAAPVEYPSEMIASMPYYGAALPPR
jgi:hypothetical protein